MSCVTEKIFHKAQHSHCEFHMMDTFFYIIQIVILGFCTFCVTTKEDVASDWPLDQRLCRKKQKHHHQKHYIHYLSSVGTSAAAFRKKSSYPSPRSQTQSTIEFLAVSYKAVLRGYVFIPVFFGLDENDRMCMKIITMFTSVKHFGCMWTRQRKYNRHATS